MRSDDPRRLISSFLRGPSFDRRVKPYECAYHDIYRAELQTLFDEALTRSAIRGPISVRRNRCAYRAVGVALRPSRISAAKAIAPA
jgi:hypothetical protein